MHPDMAQKGNAQEEATHPSHEEKALSFILRHLHEGLSAGGKGIDRGILPATRQEEGGVSVKEVWGLS